MGDKISKVKEKLTYGLELPADIVLGVPKITVIGREELTVENHKGIVRFESDEIAINTASGILRVSGRDFEIILVGGTTITVKGVINAMVYEKYDEE